MVNSWQLAQQSHLQKQSTLIMKDVVLLWDSPASTAGIDELHLFRKNGDHTAQSDMDVFRDGANQVATVSIGATTYTDVQVSVGTFTYGVFAYNSAGYGPGDLTDSVVTVEEPVDELEEDFIQLGLSTPTFDESSGGTCEISQGQSGTPDPATLYCPDLDYGGFLQATYYHSPYYFVTRFRSSVYNQEVLDDWYHVAFTRGANDDASTGAMYINGNLISVGTLMNSIGRTNNHVIFGAMAQSSWTPDNIFNGRMDQPCVWEQRALSTAEIKEIYNSGNGLAYDSWSAGVKNGATFVAEFNEDIGFDGTQYGDVVNLVDGVSFRDTYVKSHAGSNGQHRSFTPHSGKVSSLAFSPVYIDDLIYPLTITNAEAQATAARYVHQPQWIEADYSLQEGPYTLSAWVSPHGLPYGKNTTDILKGTPSKFTFEGEEYMQVNGTVFSDYSGYSNGNAFANFAVNFNGKVTLSDVGL